MCCVDVVVCAWQVCRMPWVASGLRDFALEDACGTPSPLVQHSQSLSLFLSMWAAGC